MIADFSSVRVVNGGKKPARISRTDGKAGAALRVPARLTADRAYDSDPYRKELKARRIEPEIACRGTTLGSGFGIFRYVAEQSISLLHQLRRLRAT